MSLCLVVEPPEILDTHPYLYPTLELDTSEPIVSSKQVVKAEDASKGSRAGVKVKGEEVKYTRDTNSMYMYNYSTIYMYIHVYNTIYMYVHVHVLCSIYIYIYIYICIYMYYIHVYTCTCTM